MEVNVQHHAPTALPPRKKHLLPIEKEAGCETQPMWKIYLKNTFLITNQMH
jgi:hypothetical protein